jgi:glucose/arabinose dehydrogenase
VVRSLILALLLALSAPAAAADAWSERLAQVTLAPGFHIQLFAEVRQARGIAVAPKGFVFVGTLHNSVWQAVDEDGDGTADDVREKADALQQPAALAASGTALFIAEQGRITRWQGLREFDPARALMPLYPIKSDLPATRGATRALAIGPDGFLYVAIGAGCASCKAKPGEGTIVRMDNTGRRQETVVSDIRAVLGMAWHPQTKVLWFADGNQLKSVEGASLSLGAAGAGLYFYQGDAIVAEGAHLARVRFDAEGQPMRTEAFASGFRAASGAPGKLVDVKGLADGSLVVSDETSGALYRIFASD